MYSKRIARCAALECKLGQAQGAGRQLTAAVLQGVVGLVTVTVPDQYA